MPSSMLYAAPFLLAAAAFLLPGGPGLRRAAVGTVLVSLATAAASTVIAAPPSFHTINNSILWCGIALGVIAAVGVWRGGYRAASLSLALALSLAVVGCSGVLGEGRIVLSLLAGTVGAVAISAVRVATVRVSKEPDATVVPRAARRWGMPLILALLLLPSVWFTLTVAGPDAMSLQGLREAPFSPAAEILLAALLLPASLVLAGTFPFGVIARGARFAPLGALLLLVVILPQLDEGMQHWRSLYAGWLVLNALIAAARARWPQFIAGAGLFAISCGGGAFSWSGVTLTIVASLMSLAPPADNLPRRVAMMVAACCGIVALRATLGQEVVYSTGMALGTAIAILRTSFPEAREA